MHTESPRQNAVFLFNGVYFINGSENNELLVHISLNNYAIINMTYFDKIIIGGEPKVHNPPETLGKIIKSARQQTDITIEELAEKVGITERYLYRIENEGKKPSYDVLFKLIRELSISPDLIFYPEKPSKDSEIENLIRMLYNCDERSMEVVKATVKVLIETAPKK